MVLSFGRQLVSNLTWLSLERPDVSQHCHSVDEVAVPIEMSVNDRSPEIHSFAVQLQHLVKMPLSPVDTPRGSGPDS
jgi:hypothetical protein